MLQKQSCLFITDNTSVRWLQIFHLYKKPFYKSSSDSLFIKGYVYIVEPPRIEYESFKYRYKIKGNICVCWLSRTKLVKQSLDSKGVQFYYNAGININKKVNVMSKYINGPITRAINRKKLIILYIIFF